MSSNRERTRHGGRSRISDKATHQSAASKVTGKSVGNGERARNV